MIWPPLYAQTSHIFYVPIRIGKRFYKCLTFVESTVHCILDIIHKLRNRALYKLQT